MRTPAPIRSLLCLLLPLLAAPVWAAPPRAANATAEALAVSIGIERQLLAEDLLSYAEARDRENAALRAVDDGLRSFDAALVGEEQVSQALVTRLAAALREARADAARWSSEADRLREALSERLRRLALLQRRASEARERGTEITDPVTGSWLVRSLPSGRTAVFELSLDVTVVVGSYRTDTGGWGSLRGTLVGDLLTLERIDSQQGGDLVYEGRLDRERNEVRGTWRSTLLSVGEPAAGSWVAFRQLPAASSGENP
ncbi:MAG: hypothetical protein GX178_00825 [Acidobacteria bacterium]|nr:hypothetical protein [Thermoanaerobaculia bacterium]MDI9630751.1 hypothetical protein [Acidobacteriota bacterium]OQC40554.1 MAG: hypothetical protein BWX64_01455 [Acidobacteria bacterium ADurb.Bin051]MBP7813953.1 hypothetical protein [Thermoanaerobaculia bacterium]MBP8846426.1 hypothetical protein [Thermoanaerobaculia bacterium]